MENGLPQYVSKHAKTGLYQYFRRPSKGVAGSAFTRSFGTKDRKLVWQKWPAIHAEAAEYFARLISGRTITDADLMAMTADQSMWIALRDANGTLNGPADWDRFVTAHGNDQMKALVGPDRDRLLIFLNAAYAGTETLNLELARFDFENKRSNFSERFGSVPAPANAFTLKNAYDQAWVPAKDRGKNTIVEVGRYVDEFEALNGALDLKDFERSHWAAWRKDCLEKHGPGATAFKRFSMMKTVVHEAISAGLFKRKDFEGQDVKMTKPKRTKLRNEGWQQEEIKEWFSAPVFNGAKDSPHPDTDYWTAILIAYTGAAVIEVANMNVSDVAERHGFWTFRLWRKKSANSDRIIPIPSQMIALGFLDYVETRPKNGPLFANADGERASNKLISQTFSRMRADLGITRKGATTYTYRHHIKTLLGDLGAPERVNDYITGHAPPNVGRTYGKVEFSTALRYLDQVDLGVKIPKWKG